MRDTMIKNGDIVIGSSGNTVLLEGSDAKFQQAVLCISAKLGGFVYDRNLGSKVLLQDKTLSAKQTELLANESLAKMKNTYASVKSVGRQIMIDLSVIPQFSAVSINNSRSIVSSISNSVFKPSAYAKSSALIFDFAVTL